MQGPGDSFTRVIIGELKPASLAVVLQEGKSQDLCRELSHVYHYYIHGEQGNRSDFDICHACDLSASAIHREHFGPLRTCKIKSPCVFNKLPRLQDAFQEACFSFAYNWARC